MICPVFSRGTALLKTESYYSSETARCAATSRSTRTGFVPSVDAPAASRAARSSATFSLLALRVAAAPVEEFDGAAATRKAKRLKVAELRAALEAAGASTEGTKPVLVERLVAAQRAVSLL